MGSSSGMESEDDGTYDYSYENSDAEFDGGMSQEEYASQSEMPPTRRKVLLLMRELSPQWSLLVMLQS